MESNRIDLLGIGGEEAAMKLGQIPSPLLAWYDVAARVLPWRSDPTPYHVWLSEIMLQQTRVEAVIPYYHRFLEQIPDIPSLAAADESTLHKLWEGLGYYTRVRNLQKAAVQVMERYDGMLPASYELLLDLCGIGEYTAGAISSIAFGIPMPAVDGNVLRVVSRLLASEADITKPQAKGAFRQLLLDLIPTDRAGDFNQAMMELGATVCLPNGMPRCDVCPLRFCCNGYEQGNPTIYPIKSAKKARRIEEKTIFVVCSDQGVLLSKRADRGLLAGLWEFLRVDEKLNRKQAEQWVHDQGFTPISVRSLPAAKHIFTHIEWQMKGYLVVCDKIEPKTGQVLADWNEMETWYTIPNAFSVYRRAWQEWIGQNLK